MEINPDWIVFLSTLAAISFLINRSMGWQIRLPMIIILVYFTCVYAYISASPMTTSNILIVRIGLLFLFTNMIVQNISWVIFLRRNKAILNEGKALERKVVK